MGRKKKNQSPRGGGGVGEEETGGGGGGGGSRSSTDSLRVDTVASNIGVRVSQTDGSSEAHPPPPSASPAFLAPLTNLLSSAAALLPHSPTTPTGGANANGRTGGYLAPPPPSAFSAVLPPSPGYGFTFAGAPASPQHPEPPHSHQSDHDGTHQGSRRLKSRQQSATGGTVFGRPASSASSSAVEIHGRTPSVGSLSSKRHRTSSNSLASGSRSGSKTDLLVDQPAAQKWKNFVVRTLATLSMIAAFFLVFAMGPLAVTLLIIAVQTAVYKEVIYLAHVPSKEKKLPWSRTLNWYFLISTNYFLHGESIIHYFKSSVLVDAVLLPLATYHRFISFVLYCFGFVLFVANLKKGHYKFQFQQFAWTHMTLLLVIFTSHSIINNVFEGMFWVFVPVSLVICNDIFAYICGFFWGRTPLIKLSPKKTWEGFVGAWICTMVFGILWTAIFSRSKFMTCPIKDLAITAWSDTDCVPDPVFVTRRFELFPAIGGLLRRFLFTDVRYVDIAPVHFHVLVLSCFASLIAPFGGFFASGFKRAFNIKDFGDAIPGHGGITDRMDCQFLMGLFTALYHSTFIRIATVVSVAQVLETAVNGLSEQELLELYRRLQRYILEQRLLQWRDLGGQPADALDWAG